MTRVQRIAIQVAALLGISAGTATILVEDWIDHEGWRTKVYLDSVGIPTVCAGHTGPEVRMGDVWTEEECEAATVADLVKHGRPVLQALVNPTVGEIITWVGFAGNVGVTAFLQSSARRLQNAGERVAACLQLRRWVYAGGRDCRAPGSNCRGIPIRREQQLERCLSDDVPDMDGLPLITTRLSFAELISFTVE